MPLSRVGLATRAFGAVLLLLARLYEFGLEVNRDSSPERLLKAVPTRPEPVSPSPRHLAPLRRIFLQSVFGNRTEAVEQTASTSAWGHDDKIALSRDGSSSRSRRAVSLPFPS